MLRKSIPLGSACGGILLSAGCAARLLGEFCFFLRHSSRASSSLGIPDCLMVSAVLLSATRGLSQQLMKLNHRVLPSGTRTRSQDSRKSLDSCAAGLSSARLHRLHSPRTWKPSRSSVNSDPRSDGGRSQLTPTSMPLHVLARHSSKSSRHVYS